MAALLSHFADWAELIFMGIVLVVAIVVGQAAARANRSDKSDADES